MMVGRGGAAAGLPWPARAAIATAAAVWGMFCAVPALVYTGVGREARPLLITALAIGGFLAGCLGALTAESLYPGLPKLKRTSAGLGAAIGLLVSVFLLPALEAVARALGGWFSVVGLVGPLWLGVFWAVRIAPAPSSNDDGEQVPHE